MDPAVIWGQLQCFVVRAYGFVITPQGRQAIANPGKAKSKLWVQNCYSSVIIQSSRRLISIKKVPPQHNQVFQLQPFQHNLRCGLLCVNGVRRTSSGSPRRSYTCIPSDRSRAPLPPYYKGLKRTAPTIFVLILLTAGETEKKVAQSPVQPV
jgi:hypothetical protein